MCIYIYVFPDNPHSVSESCLSIGSEMNALVQRLFLDKVSKSLRVFDPQISPIFAESINFPTILTTFYGLLSLSRAD